MAAAIQPACENFIRFISEADDLCCLLDFWMSDFGGRAPDRADRFCLQVELF